MSNGIVVTDQDKQFADRLLQMANKYGWKGDYIEVARFVDWVFKDLGMEPPPADQFEPE